MILLALIAALTERAAATGAAGEACQGKCLNPRHEVSGACTSGFCGAGGACCQLEEMAAAEHGAAARSGSMRAFGANEME